MPGRNRRIAFLASHLLSPSIASGGDILFCELAARIAQRRPEWDIVAIAPDFAAPALQQYFGTVFPIFTGEKQAAQGSPVSVTLKWFSRLAASTAALAKLQPDIVHSCGDFFVDVRPVAAARRRGGMRWSGVVHHINAPPTQRRNDFAVAAVSYALQRTSFQALRGAESISVLNQGVRTELSQDGFRAERVHVVGAGIDPERFVVAPVAKREPRVVWVNRLEPTKGMFDLPAIASQLKHGIVIDVVGRGPQSHMRSLRAQLEEAGVSDRVVLLGFLPDEEMRRIVERAAAFISCSYEEGWGISIAEALAAGLPCIAYDLPSHREIFGDAITRVPVGDTSAFASAINVAVALDETDQQRQRRHQIARKFSIEECAGRQEAIFAELMV